MSDGAEQHAGSTPVPWPVRSHRNLRITVAGLWVGFAAFAAGLLAALAWLLGLW